MPSTSELLLVVEGVLVSALQDVLSAARWCSRNEWRVLAPLYRAGVIQRRLLLHEVDLEPAALEATLERLAATGCLMVGAENGEPIVAITPAGASLFVKIAQATLTCVAIDEQVLGEAERNIVFKFVASLAPLDD